MLRRIGHNPVSTEADLEKLAAQAPKDARVLLELALAQRDLAQTTDHPDLTAAEKSADMALAVDANLGRANTLKAELMMQRLNDKHTEDAAQWKQARRFIQVANTQDTEDPLPLLAFFESYRLEGITPPAVAHDALSKAFELVPEDKNTRVEYAFDLAHEHHYDHAVQLIDFIVNDPHEPAQGRKLLAELQAIRDGVPYLETPDVDVPSDGGDGGGGKKKPGA